MTDTTTLDPVQLFEQLTSELAAARTLLVLTTEGDARRRAALDALALARDLLADAGDSYRLEPPASSSRTGAQL